MNHDKDRSAIVITGASDGIGAAAARGLAGTGRRLLLVGRSADKIDAVGRETGAQVFTAEFAEFAQVRRLADEIDEVLGDDPIAVLANNAGGMFADPTPTVDGLDLTLQVNHLSGFLLTQLLMPRLLAGRGAVVNTSSAIHRLGRIHPDRGWQPDPRRTRVPQAYAEAKLANLLHVKALHARHADRGLRSVAFHPGVVRSNFGAQGGGAVRWFYRSPLSRVMTSTEAGGAVLQWFIEGAAGRAWTSGAYYDKQKLSTRVNPLANDPALAESLWRHSADLVGVQP